MRVEHDRPVTFTHHQVGETYRPPVQRAGCGYGLATRAGWSSFAGHETPVLRQSAAGARRRQVTLECGSPAGGGAASLAPLHGSRQAGHGGVARELPARFVTCVPLVMALVCTNERGWLRYPPSYDQALGFACSEQESRSTTQNASMTTHSGGCLVTHGSTARGMTLCSDLTPRSGEELIT